MADIQVWHTKSGKSRDAIATLVERFKEGNLGDITKGLKFDVPSQFPSSKYSYRNKMMAYGQLDSIITGSGKFWKEHGRTIKKGSKAGYIFRPWMTKREDPATGEEYSFVYAYSLIPTFNIEQTEPIEGFEGEVIQAPELEPKELPPLLDIAEKLGLKVNWKPVPQDRWADYWKRGERINMGTDSPAVFFHELGHALHEAVDSEFKTRDKVYKETVAEFGAAVLMEMYLGEDHSGNAWEYIKMFDADPTKAVERSLMMVQKMFTKLEDLTSSEEVLDK